MNCCTSRTYEIHSILHSDPLWIIHVRSKPRNSRSPYRRKTNACFLPPEILRIILLHLGDEVKFCGKSLLARRWSHVVPSFTKKEISNVCAARSSLCNATLVCKTWCSVATEILYSRVALLNVAQIRLFRRTLSLDPFLAKSVKKLHIGDNKAHGTKVGGFNMFGLESVVGHRIKEDIIFIIDSCGQSLHTLSLDITKSLGNSPLDTSVFKHGDMALRSLRTLTLHSLNAPPFIARLCMPKVEVLGLQGIDLPDSNYLPYLPSLHTLRTAMGSLNPNVLSQRKFPTLRTLKTFNTDIISSEAHIGDKPGLATLENVDYLCCAKHSSWLPLFTFSTRS
ncbi:hypothetical protein C8Q75DRAFT_328913 [Abortiporus biennis]|nr:hypothetical protein C8Q75DRAFT_328913 [Abortiporus biennis]